MDEHAEPILPVLAELHRAGQRELCLDEVGRLAAMSPGHVQRRFAAVVGESPKQYQLGTRLAHAAAMLAATDLAIGEIGQRIGFGSHEAFTRAFRRRFGRSPSAHRAAAMGGSASFDPARYRTQVDEVAACVRLYRLSLTGDDRRRHTTMTTGGGPMDYEITTEVLDEVPIVYTRRRADVRAVADVLAEALPAVFGFVLGQGWAMAGPPLVRHVGQSPAFVTLEAAIPLSETPSGPIEEDGIEAGSLPAGPALTTLHTGPYDNLADAHAALDRWMAEHDLTPAGNPWEVYLTDPGEVPDPADWKTQVFWPILDS